LIDVTYKQIEASREVRLWIGQIIVPAVGLALAFPEVRAKVKEKVLDVRDSVQRKFKKEA